MAMLKVALRGAIDVFTRLIRGWELSRDLTHRLSLNALNKALKKGCPEIPQGTFGITLTKACSTQRQSTLSHCLTAAYASAKWPKSDKLGKTAMHQGAPPSNES